MRTITGTGENYAVLIDDLNIVQEVIPIPVDSLVTSNHDDLNAKKMQDLNESQVTAELAKSEYTLNILPLPEYGELCTERYSINTGIRLLSLDRHTIEQNMPLKISRHCLRFSELTLVN